MKLTLHLQAGSIGLGFDGSGPTVVRKVVQESPYAALVKAGDMVVTAVSIPNVVSVQGLAIPSDFVIALLKEYPERDDRSLQLDERPMLTQSSVGRRNNNDQVPTPTTFQIHLPTGDQASLGIVFEKALHFSGPARLKEWKDDSPLALRLIPGLQFQALQVPNVAKVERILNPERLHELLDTYKDVPGRILHLQVPLNELEQACINHHTIDNNVTSSSSSSSSSSFSSSYVPRYIVLDTKGGSLCEIVQQNGAQMAILRLFNNHQNNPNKTVIQAQPGSLVYRTGGFTEAPSQGKAASSPRLAKDERISLATFALQTPDDDTNNNNNNSNHKKNKGGTLALAPPYYRAQLFVVELEEYGGALIVGPRNFLFTTDERVMLFAYTPEDTMHSNSTTTLDKDGNNSNNKITTTSSSPTAQLLRGEASLKLQRIIGKGKVVLTAGGVVQQRTLEEKETLTVATNHLVAYPHGMPIQVKGLKGFGAVVVWGQGTVTLQGPGTVWIESHPSPRPGLLEKR
eukprot:scaffold8828_cov204-Amphora_coffeaeformis.AAC.21